MGHVESEIHNLIANDDIDLKNCWRIPEDDTFRKLRSRLHQESRTPPPPKQQR